MKKINAGWCAELFEAENSKLLKLYREGWTEEQVRREYENTKSANELGIPSPKVYEFVEQNGRYGFVMDKLPGQTMLELIQKKPFSALSLAKKMAKLHYEMHSVIPNDVNIPFEEEIYAQTINGCQGLSENEKNALKSRLNIISVKNDRRIVHGDFHPMNILLSDHGTGIIDWAFTTLGDPISDVAGTYMIAKLLAAASGGHNAFERFLFNLFTPLFANVYLKEYLKLSGRSRKEVLKWIPIRAATYVDLGLPDTANKRLYKIAKKI